MPEPSRPTYLRFLVANLRITFFLVVAVVGVIVAIALLSDSPATWEIPLFLGIGMTLSSFVNAYLDLKRARSAAGAPDGSDRSPDDRP